MSNNFIFTSESVSEGHPDKVADQISDAVLDALLAQDPRSRVACETMVKTGMVIIAGEITTNPWVDLEELVRKTVCNIGYGHGDIGFDGQSCAVLNAIGKQSSDIAMGVDEFEGHEQSAGDQGLMFAPAEPREVQHAVHPRAADAVLAHLFRQPLPAGGRCAADPGSQLHQFFGRGRRCDDCPEQWIGAGGVDLLFDKENGFLERLMSTPIHRSSVILSRFIFVITITSPQVLVILGVAFLFGVQPATGLLGVAMILLIGMMFGVGLTAISMAMAFSVKSHGDFFSVLGFLSLPLIFLSSALVPLAAMPGWMSFLAKFNPMTWAIDAVRPLILSSWTDALPHVGMVVIVMVVFDAIWLYGGAKAFRRAMG